MLTEVTLKDTLPIALGAGVLGTGGGGNTFIGRLHLQEELKKHAHGCRIIAADAIADDALVCAVSNMGAPTVGIEKIIAGEEVANTVRALSEHLRQPFEAIVIAEIGGSNALVPLIAALQLGLPVVDGDSMGRAFPELQMDTFAIGGVPASPMALGDSHGNTVIFDSIFDSLRSEEFARSLTIQMGGSAALIKPALSGKEMKKHLIRGTLSLAHRIGQMVLDCRRQNTPPAEAIVELTHGKILFTGKIVDVERRTVKGFARGRMQLVAFNNPHDTMEIVFQNENLVAWHNGAIVCTVPDLISLITLEDGEPIGTEVIRYGLRVAVLGMPAPRELKTAAALAVVGPAAFGYPQINFSPLPGALLPSSS
jgi:uncharacterized protein